MPKTIAEPANYAGLDIKAVFNKLPGMYLVLSPELKVLASTESYLQALGLPRSRVIGRQVIGLMTEVAGADSALTQTLMLSLAQVLEEKKVHVTDEVAYRKTDTG